MRKFLVPGILAVAIVAVVGVYAFVSAGGQRPMNGQIELWGGPNGENCDATSIVIELAGTGTLAHLGQTQITARNCNAGNLEVGPADILAGTSTFVAADGSTITATYDGRNEAPQGTVSEYTTTHTVTGGTGRFANASGTWTIAGTVDISTGQLLGDVSGWLSY